MTTTYGKAVRKLRIDKGVTMKDMAETLGVRSAYLSAIEMGRKRITDNLLNQVMRYFGDMPGVEKLPSLVEQSQPDMKVVLQGHTDDDRELMVAFARRFSDLSPELKSAFRTELDVMD